MTQTLLSPTAITNEALRILHQKLKFIKTVNRQYDSQFANSGATMSGKIGPNLTIRMPNQFTVSTGAALAVQDIAETSQVITASTQKHVDFTFSSQELTLTLDEFSDRYLKPAMAVLAANIEADTLSMVKDVYNFVDDDGNAISFKDILLAKQKLDEGLTPELEDRCCQLLPSHSTTVVDALKGLFNSQRQLAENYKTGSVSGNTADFDFYQNTLLPSSQATGTAAKTTGYAVDGASQTGAGVLLKTGATTFRKGDIITFAGVNRVQPESKADYGYLQQFVVTADYGGGAGTIAISPSIVTSGAGQNVTASPADGALVVKVGAGASETYKQSLFYHKDAFAVVFADLVDVSKYGSWGARQVLDGISMRIARQYAIGTDTVPCRIDTLYGYKTIRPQLACRAHADG